MRAIITFKESEKFLYDFIKSKRGYGNFIKDLIEKAYNKEQYNTEGFKND